MATNDPMTNERYQTIQAHAEIVHGWRDTPDSYADVQIPLMAIILGADVLTLLAEVDRLRAREQALAAENEQKQAQIDAMRPVVEAVAEHIGGYVSEHFRQCAFCGNGAVESRIIVHANDCEVEQARAFVAAHPTDTAAGEAEQPALRVLVSYACDRGDHERCNALASGCMCSCHAPQPPESEAK